MWEPSVRQCDQETGDDVPVLLPLGWRSTGPRLLRAGLDIHPDPLRPPSHPGERREGRAPLGVPDVAQPVRPVGCGVRSAAAIRVVLGGGGERGHGVRLGPDAPVQHPLVLLLQAGIFGKGEPARQPHHYELSVLRRHRQPAGALRPRDVMSIVDCPGGRSEQHPEGEHQQNRQEPGHGCPGAAARLKNTKAGHDGPPHSKDDQNYPTPGAPLPAVGSNPETGNLATLPPGTSPAPLRSGIGVYS